MKVIIMRGIPGSGKSTWIKNQGEYPQVLKSKVFSADNFFTKEDEWGQKHYHFDVTRIREAHDWCLKEYLGELRYGFSDTTLIVDNTNIRVFEIAPYYRLAEAFGAEVEIVWCQCNPNIALSRQTHAVPENKVWEMWKSFEAIPSWWNMIYVNTDKEMT